MIVFQTQQGFTKALRGDLRDLVDQLDDAMIPRQPDITFLIDLDPNIGLKEHLKGQTPKPGLRSSD